MLIGGVSAALTRRQHPQTPANVTAPGKFVRRDDPDQSSKQKSICFVHIGKSGGNSLVNALLELFMNQRIGNLVQLHGMNTKDQLRQERNTPKRHYTNMSLAAYARDAQGRLGPLELSSTSYTTCAAMGHVLLWVRDPVTRFISTWNFAQAFKKRSVFQSVGMSWEQDAVH